MLLGSRRVGRFLVGSVLMVMCAAGGVVHGQPAAGPAGAGALAEPFGVTNLGFYRQPAVWDDTVVFVSEGDLWRVPLAGGVASRLTTGTGEESHPAISPDGKTLAFVGEYEGTPDIYTMPLNGGLPTRRTWGASRVGFVGFAPDGRVMYSTRQFSTLPSSQTVLMDLATGATERVPLSESDQGTFDEAGNWYFTRLPFQGSHTKRYKGGYIQQLWKFAAPDADGKRLEAVPLTADFAGTSKEAMWHAGRVYFVSDRDEAAQTMNIWSMAPDGTDLRQHTRHAGMDVQWPSLHAGSGGATIVYQQGADLYRLDVGAGGGAAEPVKIDVRLTGDADQARENWIEKPIDWMTNAAISPNGDRVAITARGRVFVAWAKAGRLVDVTAASATLPTGGQKAVRYRNARFMPDGKTLHALTDESGEVEVCTLPANGIGGPTRVTTDGVVLRWDGLASPDGTMIAHSDKDHNLWITTVAGEKAGQTVKVAHSPVDSINTYEWSPDSRWLAFVQAADNMASQIRLYSLDSGVTTEVTSDRFESYSPRFSPDGKWLWFLSDRTIQSVVGSPWGPMAPEPFFDKKTKVYAVSLAAGERWPFQPEDELSRLRAERKKEEEKKKQEDKQEEKKAEEAAKDRAAPPPVVDEPATDPAVQNKAEAKPDTKPDAKAVTPIKVDVEGLAQRLFEVPMEAGNYFALSVNEKVLFFQSQEAGADSSNLRAMEIKNEKPEVKDVVSGIRSYELSRDGKKLLIHRGDTLSVIDASAGPAKLDDAAINLGGWALSVTPAQEWRQMYVDAWRLMRDYFYARNMHGVDWIAMRDRFMPLVSRVRSRAELNDVLAQMVGELAALHHFVRGGDMREPSDRIGLGSLGAELVRDEAAGGYRVERTFEFDADEPWTAPPLSRPGVEVKTGDVITAINGVALLSVADPAVLLRRQAGQQVLVTVKGAADIQEGAEGKPDADGKAATRDVIVTPISMGEAANLRYNDWEVSRRRIVEAASDRSIGYIHLRAMGSSDIAEFAKGFYPAFNRHGLIIDVRRNGGGNIDSWILSRLMRRAWMFWNQREGRAPSWNMQYAFRGHLVVICDAATASDGEAFAEGFRRLGLGKIVGQRTWGGEIWLTSSNVLVDRGIASAAEFGVFGPEGTWLIEGHGVEPDIVVDNLPHATFNGGDAQLEAAIQHLKQRIKEAPIDPAPVPPFPDKAGPR